jgi:hypothetical protein
MRILPNRGNKASGNKYCKSIIFRQFRRCNAAEAKILEEPNKRAFAGSMFLICPKLLILTRDITEAVLVGE